LLIYLKHPLPNVAEPKEGVSAHVDELVELLVLPPFPVLPPQADNNAERSTNDRSLITYFAIAADDLRLVPADLVDETL